MKLGRRPLLIAGYAALWFFDYLTAIFGFLGVSYLAEVTMIMCWVITFELTPAPITWTYLSEILSGKAMSICIAVNMISSICVVAASGYMIVYLGLPIVFIIYGTI